MTAIKPADAINLEPVTSSLRSIKLIRSNVKDLFKLLADGNQSVYDQTNQEDSTNSEFINDIQNLMNDINNRVRDLETSSALLTSSNIISSTHFGNATNLGLDPNQDKQQLYNSMVQSYRWCDKLTDAATHAHLLLNSNSLKRTIWLAFNNQRTRFQLSTRKALTNGYNVSSMHVENTINMVCKQLNLRVEFDNSFGEPTVFKIYLERVLKAVIVLRGFIIEWVNVKGELAYNTHRQTTFSNLFLLLHFQKGINEEFLDSDDKLDIWSESKYEVFRKVTEHMNTAMLHFASPVQYEYALKSFLVWFRSYSTLFEKECKKCGTRLKNFLPPTWRDIRGTYDAYHDVCKQHKL